MPAEIDEIQRKMTMLEIEKEALKKESDKTCRRPRFVGTAETVIFIFSSGATTSRLIKSSCDFIIDIFSDSSYGCRAVNISIIAIR